MGSSRVALAALVVVLVACGSSSTTGPTTSPGAGGSVEEAATPAWSYSGDTGPAYWGSLDPKFAACTSGQQQSPVDIRNPVAASLGAIDFAYHATPLVRENHGHDIEVHAERGSTMRFQGSEFDLIRFHWHAPSEHTVNGASFAAEMHMVNQTSDGRAVVVAVFLTVGTANDAYGRVWSNLPAKGATTGPDGTIDPTQLLPPDANRGSYYAYDGSLTTPPCSQGVKFLVFTTPVQVSAAQLAFLLAAYDHNNRPVQPLNGRVIQQNR